MAEMRHPVLTSWLQFGATAAIFVAAVVWGAGESASRAEDTRRSVERLADSVDKLSTAVNRNATTTERLEEHISGMDKRLDKLEKVEEWKRP